LFSFVVIFRTTSVVMDFLPVYPCSFGLSRFDFQAVLERKGIDTRDEERKTSGGPASTTGYERWEKANETNKYK